MIIWWQGAEIVPGKKSWAGERMEDAALDGESCSNSLAGGLTFKCYLQLLHIKLLPPTNDLEIQ